MEKKSTYNKPVQAQALEMLRLTATARCELFKANYKVTIANREFHYNYYSKSVCFRPFVLWLTVGHPTANHKIPWGWPWNPTVAKT